MKLSDGLSVLPGTRSETVEKFAKAGIISLRDLLLYPPLRYEDYTTFSDGIFVVEGQKITVQGVIREVKQSFIRRNFMITKVLVETQGEPVMATWYNQRFIKQQMKLGSAVSLAGVLQKSGNMVSMTVESWEVPKYADLVHTGRLVPYYSEKSGLTSRTIREKIYLAISQLDNEELEQLWLIPQNYIPSTYRLAGQTVQMLHFPQTLPEVENVRERLGLEELVFTAYSTFQMRKQWDAVPVSTPMHKKLLETSQQTFLQALPFDLTTDQMAALADIQHDFAQQVRMNRLIQGDVGSGKTAVAAGAAYMSFAHRFSTVIMAPTDILANQHFAVLDRLLKPIGVPVVLYTAAKKMPIPTSPSVVVGTHALLHTKDPFEKVALLVIDEQHRFGVEQRAILKEKTQLPHMLTMTATPIPRTLLLTLHGELSISNIFTMPPGRKPIKTHLVPRSKRESSYTWIRGQIQNEGTQVFWICPLIEESDHETMKDVKAAQKEYEYLSKEVFPDLHIALLHGRMKPKEKERIMQDFKEKKYDILVSTSVVEVGIDVPNASIMVIEGAERYGLAQLHQLRGRVGRGDKQSYCFLFSEKPEAYDKERLQVFTHTTNGLELAEYDFKERGPGDMFGTAQSGYSTLIFASLLDAKLIEDAREVFEKIIANDPDFFSSPLIASYIEKKMVKVTKD